MTEKMLICYRFEKIHYVKRRQFDRKLFGSEEKTHHGKYTTLFKGYLSSKEYERPVRSVIIVEEKYLNDILTILKEFGAQTKIFRILEII